MKRLNTIFGSSNKTNKETIVRKIHCNMVDFDEFNMIMQTLTNCIGLDYDNVDEGEIMQDVNTFIKFFGDTLSKIKIYKRIDSNKYWHVRIHLKIWVPYWFNIVFRIIFDDLGRVHFDAWRLLHNIYNVDRLFNVKIEKKGRIIKRLKIKEYELYRVISFDGGIN